MIDEKQLESVLAEGLSSLTYPAEPAGLYHPVEYTLESGGKRLRPLLALASAQAVGANPRRALPQALAVEMFHNFTLIHDDVMDRSPMRRGRPTVFNRWGSTQAILSGDALLTLATRQACRCQPELIADVLELFNKTALEVYEGQQYDMDFEQRGADVTVDEYLRMIRLKTSVLLGCACAMGALAGGADRETADALYTYGVELGVAFQLRDDWLDTFGDAAVFGKPIGGDIINNKHTWLYITARTEAPEKMEEAYSSSTPGGVISAVTEVYRSLKLDTRCDALVSEYRRRAEEALSKAKIAADDRRWFEALASRLCHRMK